MEALVAAINKLKDENTRYNEEMSLSMGASLDQGEQQNIVLKDILDQIIGSREDAKYDAEEARRDSQAPQSPAPRPPATQSEEVQNPFGELKGILQTLAGIGAAVTGLVTGFVKQYAKITLGLLKLFTPRAIAGYFRTLANGLGRVGTLLLRGIDRAFEPFRRFLRLEIFDKPRALFTNVVTSIRNTFTNGLNRITQAVDTVRDVFRGLIKPITDLGTRIRSFFTGGFARVGTAVDSTVGTMIRRITDSVRQIGALIRSSAGAALNTGAAVVENAGKAIGRVFTTAKGNLLKQIDNIQKAFTAGTNGVRGVSRSLNGTFRSLNVIEKISRAFGQAVTFTSNNLIKPIKTLTGFGERAGKAAQAFAKMKGALGGIFRAFASIGRFIAFPVTFIMGVIDAFKGAQRGAERQTGTLNKIIGGISGAIFGVFKGLIMVPLDLIKDAFSWILGKVGLGEFSAILDSFSFADSFMKLGDVLTDGLLDIFDGLYYNFKKMGTELMKPFQDGFSFEALIEFVTNIPRIAIGGALDMMKTVASSILNMLGFEDAANLLTDFSFMDHFGKIIDFVVALPGKLVDGLMGILTGEIDIGEVLSSAMSTAGNMAAQFNEYLKSVAQPYLQGLAQDDSWLGSIGKFVVPEPAFEWAGVDKDTGEITDPVTVTAPESSRAETAEPSAPDVTPRTATGEQLDQQSRENAQAQSSGSTVVVADGSSKTTVNNTSQTAAVIDQNLPTQDMNDRSWSFA